MTSIPLLKKESNNQINENLYSDSEIHSEHHNTIELVETTQCFDSYKRQSKRLSRLSRQICMPNKYISLHRPKIKRWKLYEGKSRLYCHGRIVTGNDNVTFVLSMLLIITPCVFFIIYVLPEFHIAYTYIFIYIALFCSASLLKTSWTDPGILPRNLEPQLNEVPLNSSETPSIPANVYNNTRNQRYDGSDSVISSSASSSTNYRRPLPSSYPFINSDKPFVPSSRNIIINGRIVRQKFCDTCKIYRPPRSFHCNFCDNCVENCDHHCPWTANCIGKRNYRYFYAFISSSTIVCISVFLGSIIMLHRKRHESHRDFSVNSIIDTILEYPVPFILLVFVILVGWSVTFLSCYHTTLIFRNITTHEQLKEQYIPNTNKSYFNTGNPFKNMMLVLFRPIPPSRFAMRQYVSVPLNTNLNTNTNTNINIDINNNNINNNSNSNLNSNSNTNTNSNSNSKKNVNAINSENNSNYNPFKDSPQSLLKKNRQNKRSTLSSYHESLNDVKVIDISES